MPRPARGPLHASRIRRSSCRIRSRNGCGYATRQTSAGGARRHQFERLRCEVPCPGAKLSPPRGSPPARHLLAPPSVVAGGGDHHRGPAVTAVTAVSAALLSGAQVPTDPSSSTPEPRTPRPLTNSSIGRWGAFTPAPRKVKSERVCPGARKGIYAFPFRAPHSLRPLGSSLGETLLLRADLRTSLWAHHLHIGLIGCGPMEVCSQRTCMGG